MAGTHAPPIPAPHPPPGEYPPPPATTSATRSPWFLAAVILAVLVVVCGAVIVYQWASARDLREEVATPFRAEIEDLQGRIAALDEEKSALDSDIAAFGERQAGFQAEIDRGIAALRVCQQAAEIGQEFTAQFEGYHQLEGAFLGTAEGSQEESDLLIALEAELSALRDTAASLKLSAAACLGSEADA